MLQWFLKRMKHGYFVGIVVICCNYLIIFDVCILCLAFHLFFCPSQPVEKGKRETDPGGFSVFFSQRLGFLWEKKSRIEELVMTFMRDPRNVMLCVEQVRSVSTEGTQQFSQGFSQDSQSVVQQRFSQTLRGRHAFCERFCEGIRLSWSGMIPEEYDLQLFFFYIGISVEIAQLDGRKASWLPFNNGFYNGFYHILPHFTGGILYFQTNSNPFKSILRFSLDQPWREITKNFTMSHLYRRWMINPYELHVQTKKMAHSNRHFNFFCGKFKSNPFVSFCVLPTCKSIQITQSN